MASDEEIIQAIAQGVREAFKAVPAQRMSPMEIALSCRPEQELEYATYLTGELRRKVTGKAATHVQCAWLYLKEMRAAINPDLEKHRCDD